MTESKLIQIDLQQVLAQKLGNKARWVPRWLVRWLEKTICQDELNAMLRRYYPCRGAEFCQACMADMEVKATVRHAELLPAPGPEARVIFVCNHPLGGLDGIVLIAELYKLYPGIKFVVNDLLMAVEPLQEVFLPINKHGRQNRLSTQAISAAMDGPDPVLVFPAGLVSRRGADGQIRDLDWHKMFVTKALQHKRDVVPLHFDGLNSPSFYNIAQRRKRLGLKFNFEMIYLPREVVRSRGKDYTITVGQRIPWQQLLGKSPAEAAAEVKEKVYALANKPAKS